MTDPLPLGWAHCSLGDVGAWGSGGTPARSNSAFYRDGTIPWLVIGDLNDGVVSSSALAITAEGLANSSAKLLEPGTLLVAMYGSIGKVGITGVKCATNQAIAFCRPKPGISLRYLFRLLQEAKPALVHKGKGGTQQNISQGVLKEHTVRLAPSAEQQRIADKLDTVLARVDACRDRLARVAPLLKRFRQSVLVAATSGGLTDDWREANPGLAVDPSALITSRRQFSSSARDAKLLEELIATTPPTGGDSLIPRGWLKTCVGLVGVVSNGSTPARDQANYWGGTIPWVSSGEVRDAEIFQTRECVSQVGFDNSSVRMLPPGAVLIAMIGEGRTRGQSALLSLAACINQNVAGVVALSNYLEPRYLWRWFQAQYETTRLQGNGTGPQALNCQRVREIPVNLPPPAEQLEIVRRVDTLFAFADRLEARLAQAQTAVDRLTPSLLSKAFRGELVPQDPADEPAAELLKRLAASRTAPTAKTRKPRQGQPA